MTKVLPHFIEQILDEFVSDRLTCSRPTPRTAIRSLGTTRRDYSPKAWGDERESSPGPRRPPTRGDDYEYRPDSR